MDAGLTAEQWTRINDTVVWIHSQRCPETLQRGTLERLFGLIDHDVSFFDLCDDVGGPVTFVDPVSTTLSSVQLADYYQNYESSDYVAWCFTRNAPVVYRDSDMISPEVREGSEIYRRWMEPIGIYYSMGCTAVDHGVIYGSITLFRRRGKPDFSTTDLKILTEINRHLSAHFTLLWPYGAFAGRRPHELETIAREARLTDRETEVLRLVAEARTNREIAQELYLSESTVKKHVNMLYKKTHVRSRMQLTRLLYGPPRGEDATATEHVSEVPGHAAAR